MSQASEEMTDNENWHRGLGVAQHLGGDRTATVAVSAGKANCVQGSMSMNSVHIWEMGILSLLWYVSLKQPAETLRSSL